MSLDIQSGPPTELYVMTSVYDDPEFRNATFVGNSLSQHDETVFLKVYHKRSYNMAKTFSGGLQYKDPDRSIVVTFSSSIGHLGVSTDPQKLEFDNREEWAMIKALRKSADDYTKRTVEACVAAACVDDHRASVHPEILCCKFSTEDYDAVLMRSAGRCILEVEDVGDLCERVLRAHQAFFDKTNFVYADNNLENVFVTKEGKIQFIDVEGCYLATKQEYGDYMHRLGRSSYRTCGSDTLARDWLSHAVSVLPKTIQRQHPILCCLTPEVDGEWAEHGSPSTPPSVSHGVVDLDALVKTPRKLF
ncbi:hypothetical protein CYMTET_42045 [Cymbomonas tetramitiformis]|uniref:Uncharacterized protein n=1 Tax=Cymbomonas tetramitiformis TaxID=36881 RepID=A0AAE0BZX6_9CHLO|nr:hypothetical protein CYMTET_44667 [Cymbomonas tetramitiformis]KAK3248488.1 hypothetical protein CYMTET_42050 [Cymbomonas tetramitiformis]KAK3248494.1 hypothetical protein CYMTET_42045 [Cymbomonas tetramitiformis]|eukprot:gene27318-33651_t